MAAVAAVAVDAARHAAEQPAHELGDHFLRELVRAEHVIAARDDHGKLEGVVVRLDDVLGRRLGRRVRVRRLEYVRLDATDVVADRAVDLVSGDVDEALDAVHLGGLHEHVRAHHIVLSECERIAKGVVDVCLGGGMDDGVNTFRLEHVLDEVGGEQVAFNELEVRAILNLVQVF